MTNGTVQFWWAVRAFASALLGACLFAAALLLWNMENLLWGGGVLSTIGALAGSWAGWRLMPWCSAWRTTLTCTRV